MKTIVFYLVLAFLAFFGLLTLFLSGSVIFDWFGIRAKEGNYVLFIVWINFIVSFLYLVAAYSLYKHKKWTSTVLGFALVLLILGFLGLLIYISYDGIYEVKTIKAMLFRMSLTTLFLLYSYFTFKINSTHKN